MSSGERINIQLTLCSLQDIVEQDNGTQKVAPPILQLSAEKMTRYGIFLMDYGMVRVHVFYCM